MPIFQNRLLKFSLLIHSIEFVVFSFLEVFREEIWHMGVQLEEIEVKLYTTEYSEEF